MSSENPDSPLSELISRLIPLLKKELRKDKRDPSDRRRRNLNQEDDCGCNGSRRPRENPRENMIGSPPKRYCTNNPKRCYVYIDGQWVEEPVVISVGSFLASHTIDNGITFVQAGSKDMAVNYVKASVEAICGNEPLTYPFPWPLPRDFTTAEFSQEDWYDAAVEFENAAKAIVGDEVLRGLFREQASKLLEQSLKTPDLP
jgi:hypothetical protein